MTIAAEPPATTRSAPRPSARRIVLSILAGVVRLAVVVGLIGSGVFAAYWFNTTEGASQKSDAALEEASRLVEIIRAERVSQPVRIRAMGTVMPAREAVIRPRVAGMIVEQSESFVPGGYFRAGEFMLQIDRADYEQALLQRSSDLARAEAALQIELGDQAVAQEELELLEVDIPEINRELILRVPQVNQAKAEVRSAEAAVQRAALDLDRTTIVAPFDGHIVERAVTIGNNVSAGDDLATLVGAEQYWIELAVPVASLRWIRTGDDPLVPGSRAVVRYPGAWGPDASREGEVMRQVGRLEQGSRLARLLVSVADPLAHEKGRADRPDLILGAFVDVEIEGHTLENVIVLDRDHVREGDVVWTMDESDRLRTRPVTIVHRGRDEVYITAGLDHGDRIVTTNLTTPVDGMLLRAAGDAAPAATPVAGASAGGPPDG